MPMKILTPDFDHSFREVTLVEETVVYDEREGKYREWGGTEYDLLGPFEHLQTRQVAR